MHPKPIFKLLLSLLLFYVLCVPLLVAGDKKPASSPTVDAVKTPADNAPPVKAKAKQQKLSGYPKRGMSMKKVRKHYGEPKSIRKSKGKVKKLWPRITVWNYGAYSVYFERHIVLHTVVH